MRENRSWPVFSAILMVPMFDDRATISVGVHSTFGWVGVSSKRCSQISRYEGTSMGTSSATIPDDSAAAAVTGLKTEPGS